MTQHGKQPHRHRARREDATAGGRDYFAVLLTDRPPHQPLTLPATPEQAGQNGQRKYRFAPLMHFAERGASLGLAALAANDAPPAEVRVQRGKRGQPVAETLLLLGPAQAGIASWPKPRLAGVLKAVGRALDDICVRTQPCLPFWWLACQLALRGAVTRAEWKTHWRQQLDARPDLGPRIERLGPYLAWNEYLLMLSDSLEHQLLKGKRNPLLTELTPAAAAQLVRVDEEHLAPRLLELLAQKHGLALSPSGDRPALALTGALAPPRAHDQDLRVVEEITTLFANDEGLSRAMLAQRYPAHKHVLHWLFSAGLLVETAAGYVFTREQLRTILVELAARGIAPADVSTGVLRKELGLKRPAAEQLRQYFQQRYGSGTPAAGGRWENSDG